MCMKSCNKATFDVLLAAFYMQQLLMYCLNGNCYKLIFVADIPYFLDYFPGVKYFPALIMSPFTIQVIPNYASVFT